MGTIFMTCRVCNGTDSANNPPVFHEEGVTPEVSKNCEYCGGTGRIPINNPIGIRVSWLLAQRTCKQYPELGNVDYIYEQIVTNISNETNHYSETLNFEIVDGDMLFSTDSLEIDKNLERIILRGNFEEEVKIILKLA